MPSAYCLVPHAHSVLPQNVPADLPRPLPASPPLCLWLCFLPAVCPAQGAGSVLAALTLELFLDLECTYLGKDNLQNI